MKSELTEEKPTKYSDRDVAYMQSLSAAVVERSPKHMLMVVSLIAAVVLVALLWMGWAEIDVVVRGTGKVIPARQVQKIQSLEGGIITEILVHEGDLVEISQPLLKISDVAFTSSFEENRLSYYELRAKSARLKAEAYTEEFVRDAEVEAASPALLLSEEGLFESIDNSYVKLLVSMKSRLVNRKALWKKRSQNNDS